MRNEKITNLIKRQVVVCVLETCKMTNRRLVSFILILKY